MVVTIRPYVRRIDADTIGLYTEDLTKLLQLDKATTNYTTLAGQASSGKHLKIRANAAVAIPYIMLNGASYRVATGGYSLDINNHAGTLIGRMGEPGSGTGFQIGAEETNADLILAGNGTGTLRFGTHSALAGETLSGYITIKDSGGTSRKLAVIS